MTHSSADTLSVQNPPEGPATSSVRWVVLFGVWGTYFCFGLTIAGLAPLIEPITRDLGISHKAMGGVLGVWQLVYIAAAVPCAHAGLIKQFFSFDYFANRRSRDNHVRVLH